MTEDQAVRALRHLADAFPGFTDPTVDEFIVQFVKLDDVAALEEVCEQIAASTDRRTRPYISEVMGRYYAHPRVRDEREARVASAMLDEFAGRVVPYAEGWAIANDAYRATCKRNIGEKPTPDPNLAENLIVLKGRRDKEGNWVADYIDVLAGFHGDQLRTQASLRALGRRLVGQGKLTLLPPPPDTTIAPPPASPPDPPTPPAERPLDASRLTEAIGITRSKLEES